MHAVDRLHGRLDLVRSCCRSLVLDVSKYLCQCLSLEDSSKVPFVASCRSGVDADQTKLRLCQIFICMSRIQRSTNRRYEHDSGRNQKIIFVCSVPIRPYLKIDNIKSGPVNDLPVEFRIVEVIFLPETNDHLLANFFCFFALKYGPCA